MPKDDSVYLRHIRDAATRIGACLADVTEDRFRADWMLQDVVCRELEIIGEAASQTSEELKARHTDVPWRTMVGVRNRLIHAYASVDLAILWGIARSDLPGVLEKVETILMEGTV